MKDILKKLKNWWNPIKFKKVNVGKLWADFHFNLNGEIFKYSVEKIGSGYWCNFLRGVVTDNAEFNLDCNIKSAFEEGYFILRNDVRIPYHNLIKVEITKKEDYFIEVGNDAWQTEKRLWENKA